MPVGHFIMSIFSSETRRVHKRNITKEIDRQFQNQMICPLSQVFQTTSTFCRQLGKEFIRQLDFLAILEDRPIPLCLTVLNDCRHGCCGVDVGNDDIFLQQCVDERRFTRFELAKDIHSYRSAYLSEDFFNLLLCIFYVS
ncbi:hypothetical protein QWT68_10125 [Sporosarcina trichiuri]|nr:hypothetical protein [Sporosarcina sp. 0.2-SM1T-5]WJY26438.1 hypothetical protein QWT68_10125 [Sporosarcina sp. 0.2-SM1T-5]